MIKPAASPPVLLLEFPYRCARKGGGVATEGMLPILALEAAGLPESLDGLILAADLQGRELLPPTRRNADSPARNFREGRRLLGEVAAERIADLSRAGRLPPADRLGIVLAGDLWAEPGTVRRGRSGDVRPVWRAFRECGRWVAGVRGNHDVFLDAASDRGEGIHLLDAAAIELDGLRLGGVGGVIGNPTKQRTRTEARFTDLVRRLVADRVDLIVLHEGPAGTAAAARGSRAVRAALEGHAGLVVFGHCYWPVPLERTSDSGWLINVDSRVLVLLRPGSTPRPCPATQG